MLRQNLFGLGTFKLIESSEQGMLAEAETRLPRPRADRVSRLGTRTR